MPRYAIELHEIRIHNVEFEADDEDHAQEIAHEIDHAHELVAASELSMHYDASIQWKSTPARVG